MEALLKTRPQGHKIPGTNIVELPITEKKAKPRRTASPYKSDGKPKATAADPIRDVRDIQKMKEYFLAHNQLRDYTIFVTGLSFGIRAGDLLALRVGNVRDANGMIRPRCNVYEQKTGKFNQPQITAQIAEALTHWLGANPQARDTDYLFPSRQRDANGEQQHVKINQLNNVLRKAAAACEIRAHISSHSLRKTMCYHALRENQGDTTAMATIQYMMNHSSMSTTLRYCGLTQDDAGRVRDTWVDSFMGDGTEAGHTNQAESPAPDHTKQDESPDLGALMAQMAALQDQLTALTAAK